MEGRKGTGNGGGKYGGKEREIEKDNRWEASLYLYCH